MGGLVGLLNKVGVGPLHNCRGSESADDGPGTVFMFFNKLLVGFPNIICPHADAWRFAERNGPGVVVFPLNRAATVREQAAAPGQSPAAA